MADLPPDPSPDHGAEGDADAAAPAPTLEAVRPRGPGLGMFVVAVVVALVLIVGSVGTSVVRFGPPSPAIPSAPPVAGTLAVTDDAGTLRTVDDRGGSSVTYPGPGLIFQFPAWSPDGSRIAVVGTSNGGTGDTGVYVFGTPAKGAAASEGAVIYRSEVDPPFYLYWAPDGRQVTFLTSQPDGIALRVAPADAGDPGTTLRHGSPLYWAFVDGSRILVHSGGDASDAFVGEVGLDGTVIDAAAGAPGPFRPPAVSADGRYRAYAAPGAGSVEAVVVEATDHTGRHEIPIVGPAAVSFDPSGDSLAFLAAEPPGADQSLPIGPLRLVDPATGTVRTLLAGAVVAFFWSPDGKTIAALVIPAPGVDAPAAAHGVIPAVAPIAAPGIGLGLVFVDTADGTIRSKRSVSLGDTFVNQVLPYFDQYALSHRLWSPDSREIALPTVDETGANQVFVLPADGVDARAVASGIVAFWSPRAGTPDQ